MQIEANNFKITIPSLLFDPQFHVFDFSTQKGGQTKLLLVEEKKLSEAPFIDVRFEPLAAGSFVVPTERLFSIEAQHNIMNHIVEQLLTETAPNRLFSLDDVEMQKILDRHPTSLKEVQSLILKTIALKTDNPDLLDQQRINEQLGLNNPDILLAARLGKHALKDPKLMNTLWSTLRSQTKIAKLLGVNRSSVNRRCKEYSLQ